MLETPEEYKWSSYGVNAWGDTGCILAHEEYQKLGNYKDDRCSRYYREMIKQSLDIVTLHSIRKAAQYSHPVGGDRFKREIESKYWVRLGRHQEVGLEINEMKWLKFNFSDPYAIYI